MINYFIQSFAADVMLPHANAIITNIQDPLWQCPHGSPPGTAKDCSCRTKRKRKSRAQLTPGRPLSFYEVIEAIRTRNEKRSHPSTAMVYWGRPMSVFYLSAQPIWKVLEAARSAQIGEVIRPEGLPCHCDECNQKRVKKPRGPKRQPDGTILFKDYSSYRGGLAYEEMQELKRVVVNEKGKRTYPAYPMMSTQDLERTT
jgi:uncharacterized protein (UPF0179 family)